MLRNENFLPKYATHPYASFYNLLAANSLLAYRRCRDMLHTRCNNIYEVAGTAVVEDDA
jgi:hypothetical protein